MSEMIQIPHGFKQTILGVVPDEWELSTLENHSEYITKGSTPTTYGFEWVESGILFLRSECVSEHGLLLQPAMKISAEANDALRRSQIKAGDLLMTITGNVGRVIKLPEDFAGGNINQHIARIRINEESVNVEFVYHFLSQNKIRDSYLAITTGQAYPQISLKQVRATQIPLPPLPEQQKIAEILNIWDQAISTTQKLIDELKLRNKGLAQQLLTGKKRLRGFEGEWKEIKVGDITEKFSKRNKSLINARIYSVTNYSGFVLQSEHFARELAGEDLTSYKIISKGEFAYNPARINVGSIAYFDQAEKGIISSLYVCFRTTSQVMDRFMSYWIGLEKTIHDFGRFGEGGVRVYLWYDLFASIKIKIPSIDEQVAIVSILDKAGKELKLHQKQLDTLKEQKKGLMQKLLTGEIRVKTKEN